ncbi:MAG: hypothetical protein RBR38_10270 [Desulfomicrobium apsheronum]|nr:hypothetical protein [Desulfomicrobium apsheronum]
MAYEYEGNMVNDLPVNECEDELSTLRARVARLEKALKEEVAALKVAAVHIYNSGYHAGHHYTVEGGYVDIHPSDMDTYHAEEVAELLAALVGEVGR